MCHRDRVLSGAGKARAAFDRAVAREHEAIERHEAAARQQDEMAAELERHAADETDELKQHKIREHAAATRARADSARERAARARQRLRDEGLDPVAETTADG